MASPDSYHRIIKKLAREHGFQHCGIARAEYLESEAPRLEKWLKRGFHGQMSYMENHFDKRLDPTKLVPGAKSLVSIMYNYFPEKSIPSDDNFKIAKYAYGEDYHHVIKKKLRELLETMRQQIGDIQGRAFVDSAPVMERAWAQRAGLGWIGKHSLLLNRSMGSFFFLAELIIDLEITPDSPMGDYCGTCTACMDACPTDAIPVPYTIDSNRCISYLTIELKESIPASFSGMMEDWIFGCDICQDVCPWNRFSSPHNEPAFEANDELRQLKKHDWVELTEETFRKVFKKSAVKRTKFSGLKRNIEIAKGRETN